MNCPYCLSLATKQRSKKPPLAIEPIDASNANELFMSEQELLLTILNMLRISSCSSFSLDCVIS
jgi:hypothetical protein